MMEIIMQENVKHPSFLEKMSNSFTLCVVRWPWVATARISITKKTQYFKATTIRSSNSKKEDEAGTYSV